MSHVEKVNHRAAWTAKSLTAQSADWIYSLQPDDIAELDAAMRAIKAKGLVVPNFNKDDFPLPGLMAHLAKFKEELEFGLGIMLLKGLPIERYSKDDASIIFWASAPISANRGNRTCAAICWATSLTKGASSKTRRRADTRPPNIWTSIPTARTLSA